jgi:hypothetical protein
MPHAADAGDMTHYESLVLEPAFGELPRTCRGPAHARQFHGDERNRSLSDPFFGLWRKFSDVPDRLGTVSGINGRLWAMLFSLARPAILQKASFASLGLNVRE